MKAYSQSAGYAEQAISAIRVVHSYGMELVEQLNYQRFLHRAKKQGLKTACKQAFGIASLQAGLFFFYFYSIMIGSIVMLKPNIKNNRGEPYSGGDVFSCMFGVVFGVFSMGPVAPNIKCLVEGRIAGKMAYHVIDRVPQIQVNDRTQKQV